MLVNFRPKASPGSSTNDPPMSAVKARVRVHQPAIQAGMSTPASSPQRKVASAKGLTPLRSGHSAEPSTDTPKSTALGSLKQDDTSGASNEDQDQDQYQEEEEIQQRNLFSNDNDIQGAREVHNVDHEMLDMLS